jgi:hypothetical protein
VNVEKMRRQLERSQYEYCMRWFGAQPRIPAPPSFQRLAEVLRSLPAGRGKTAALTPTAGRDRPEEDE